MSEFKPESGWYSTGVQGWYKTTTEAEPETTHIPPAPRRRKTGVIAGVTSVAAVMLLSILFIFVIRPLWELTENGLPTVEKPGVSQDDDIWTEVSPFDFPDYRDFFSNYYTSTTTPASGSRIERYEGSSFALSLESSEGMEELSNGEIYAKCVDSVVGIVAQKKGVDGYNWGTGAILSADGYVITNEHVIDDTDFAFVVTSDGERYEAKVVGEDSRTDIAVLKVEAENLKPARFGISDELTVGDRVVAIGNPLGDELTGTMTEGIVSALNRNVLTSDGISMTLIQTDAAINEGNSGGPLINMYGQVIGITNMKMAADYYQVTIEGIGFAIPTSSALADINTLASNGHIQRPGLGITIGSIPQSAIDQYELPEGLYISDVVEASDCYAKGIRAGDVLTAVNGQHVTTIDEVSEIKDTLQVGDTLTLTIFRDGVTTDIEIELYDMNELY